MESLKWIKARRFEYNGKIAPTFLLLKIIKNSLYVRMSNLAIAELKIFTRERKIDGYQNISRVQVQDLFGTPPVSTPTSGPEIRSILTPININKLDKIEMA